MKRLAISFIFALLILGIFSNSILVLASDDDDSGSDNSGSDKEDSNSGRSDDEEDFDENEFEDEREDIDSEELKERSRSIQEFRADDGSRIKIEREIKVEEGKTIIEIRKKILNADGTETEIKVKIIDKEEDSKIKKVIKIEGVEDFEIESELEIEEETNNNESILEAITKNGSRQKILILPDEVYKIVREKISTENFTAELKEIERQGVPRVIYNVETNTNGKFLGIFKLKFNIEGEIDSETGELIGVRKPWWTFLVSEESLIQADNNESSLNQ